MQALPLQTGAFWTTLPVLLKEHLNCSLASATDSASESQFIFALTFHIRTSQCRLPILQCGLYMEGRKFCHIYLLTLDIKFPSHLIFPHTSLRHNDFKRPTRSSEHVPQHFHKVGAELDRPLVLEWSTLLRADWRDLRSELSKSNPWWVPHFHYTSLLHHWHVKWPVVNSFVPLGPSTWPSKIQNNA